MAILYVFFSRDLPSCTKLPTQEDTLSDLVKKTGGFALGALIGKGGSKFGGLDIKRVYFGSAYLTLSFGKAHTVI
jgi:hypothetical protein